MNSGQKIQIIKYKLQTNVYMFILTANIQRNFIINLYANNSI